MMEALQRRDRAAGGVGMQRHLDVLRRVLWRLRSPVLALGGGGARGFAHLGVLQVLDELGLEVRGIAGTSMGAVIGAMYLAYGSAEEAIARWQAAISKGLVPPVRPLRKLAGADEHEHPLTQLARRIRNQVVVAFAINRSTALDDKDLARAFEFLIPDIAIEELRRPMVAVSTDLESGAAVRLREGSLRQVLKASSAIPGLLPAVAIGGRRLVDGGVVGEVPVAAARTLGWPVVAVDVSLEIPPLRRDDMVLDIMMRTQMMTARLLRERALAAAHIVIRPRVGYATWAEWNRFDELVAGGRRAAEQFFGLPEDAS
jgi:NTE family protein